VKRIINQKRYDTDKAVKVGEYWNGLSKSDFGHITETLYRKRTGEFFLHGVGGANTKYAKAVGTNCWHGDERLMPMEFETARKWAEQHLTADEYENIFGAVEEDDSRKVVTFSLTLTAIEKLKKESSRTGMTQSDIVDMLILKM